MRSLTVRSLSVAALAGLLALCTARAAAQEARDAYRLFLPGHQRALDIDLREFDVTYEDLPGEPAAGPNKWGRARLVRLSIKPEKGKRKWHTPFVVRVEEVRAGAAAEALRETAAESLLKFESVSKDSVKRDAYKETALLRYTVKGPRLGQWSPLIFTGYSPIPVRSNPVPGSALKFPVLEAFQVRDGVWVWVRCDAFEIKEEEEKLLRSLLDSVRVVDTSRPSTSFDYYHLGRALYQQKEHAAAVAALAQAFDLERERRQLGQPTWRQLVMTLANALGAADDPARARDVLEYAVGVDPTNAPLHYGLARLHGFFGDMDRAVASLGKAYEHAPKPGGFFLGVLPDPLTDVAFARFKDDPRFRDAVKAAKKKSKR